MSYVNSATSRLTHDPVGSQASADEGGVRDVIEFLDFLLQYLYTLPHEIKQYRERRTGKTTND